MRVGPSSLRSPANSGELRRTRRSLGGGGRPPRATKTDASRPSTLGVGHRRSRSLTSLIRCGRVLDRALEDRVEQKLERAVGLAAERDAEAGEHDTAAADGDVERRRLAGDAGPAVDPA